MSSLLVHVVGSLVLLIAGFCVGYWFKKRIEPKAVAVVAPVISDVVKKV